MDLFLSANVREASRSDIAQALQRGRHENLRRRQEACASLAWCGVRAILGQKAKTRLYSATNRIPRGSQQCQISVYAAKAEADGDLRVGARAGYLSGPGRANRAIYRFARRTKP